MEFLPAQALGRSMVRRAVMFVEELMTRRPPVCYRSQPLAVAARLMCHHDLAAIPVVDADSKLIGMLSVNDLVRWEARRSASRRWIRALGEPVLVSHVMTHEVVSASTGESISDVARVMQYVTRSVLPVLESGGSLVGIVSAKDIASALARTDDSIRAEIHDRFARLSSAIPVGTINVHVDGGIVTLTGVAGSQRDLHAMRRTVATVTGVVGIQSELFGGSRAKID